MTVPIPRPGKIVCVGLNYRDHAEEQGVDLPAAPLFFAKYTTSLIGPGDAIVIPSVVTKCDYEAELGVVLGATVRNVSKENALEAVAGYVVANDVSARDLQFADGQWTRGKSPDTFCPVGPLVPAADVPADPSTSAGGWKLELDEQDHPQAWVGTDEDEPVPSVCVGPAGTARGLLDAAVSAPSRAAVRVDNDGRFVGLVTYDAIGALLATKLGESVS